MGILVWLKELQTFKPFFFEKKKQETFYFWVDTSGLKASPNLSVFAAAFLKKVEVWGFASRKPSKNTYIWVLCFDQKRRSLLKVLLFLLFQEKKGFAL